ARQAGGLYHDSAGREAPGHRRDEGTDYRSPQVRPGRRVVRLKEQDMASKTSVTRRRALGACAIAPAALIGSLQARAKATAFALIGDRYHNSDYIRTGLSRTLG